MEDEERIDPAGRVKPGGVRRVGEKKVRLGLEGMGVPSSSKCWRGGGRGVERGKGAVRLEMEGSEGELFAPREWGVGGVLQSAGLLVLVLERDGELEGWLEVA